MSLNWFQRVHIVINRALRLLNSLALLLDRADHYRLINILPKFFYLILFLSLYPTFIRDLPHHYPPRCIDDYGILTFGADLG